MADDSDAPHDRPPAPDAQASPLAGRLRLSDRFEVLRWLGEGGMGTVYLAHDEKLGRRVAIKMLLGAEPDALARFKREFRALADISHPNLIVLHELFCLESAWLFTMDYVEGEDFLSHVSALDGRNAPTLLEVEAHRLRAAARSHEAYGRPRCPLRDERVFRLVLTQLADAVRALHDAGKLHLDLKPSNVLVSRNGHVTVLDFGLARDLHHSANVRTQRVLGTPAYMAPEQAQGKPFEPASDWYAVGAMMYEALTGRLPFEGSIPEILLGKCERDAVPPSQLARGVPPDLEALCMALLSREPQKRPSAREITERLGLAPRQLLTPIRQPTTGELFVGRTSALETMRRELAPTPEPRMLLLHGQSGVGKTTVVRRFLRELSQNPDTVVLSGACYEREAVPFKAFDGVIDALAAHLSSLSAAELASVLPRHAQALARLFPALSKLTGKPAQLRAQEPEDPGLFRARAFRAFAELFGRLSDRARLVVFIDDLHWGDLDSALLLRELFEGEDPIPMLLIGTYRRAEASASPFFRELSALSKNASRTRIDHVEIDALSREEARALAEQLLARAGHSHTELSAHIAEESHGVPLFVHELVRHAAGETEHDGARISLRDALGARIARLPPAAARLLDVLAVMGKPLEQRTAYRAAQLSHDDQSTLHTLRAAGLAKSRGAGPDDVVETYHDRIRAVVVSRLQEDERKALHERLLSVLEEERHADVELLLTHSLGAHEPKRALAYAERAAERATEALAFNRSAELYQIALDCLHQAGVANREREASLRQGLAEALAAAGRCLEAADAYLEAQALAPPEKSSVLERNAADQRLRGGDLSGGIALLKRVLARIGISYPHGARSAMAALTYERARLYARGLAFEEKAPEALSASELEALETLRVALGVYWLVEPVRGAVFATQYLRRALDAGHARHILRALETEGAYLALSGGAKAEAKAGEIYATCASLAKRIGSASTQSGYHFAEAGFHGIYGRKQKSTECALKALAQPNQPGLSWERAYARFLVYQNCLYIGGKPGLAQEIEQTISEAEQRKDRFGVAILLPTLAMAQLMGDAPEAALHAMERMRPCLSEEVFSFLDVQEMIWTALSHQYRGDTQAALDCYARHHERYAASGMPRLQLWRALTTWGTMLAHLAALAKDPTSLSHQRTALERIKQIEREAVAWPQAFASMGRAVLAHLAKDDETRDEALRRALRQAEQMGYAPFASLFARQICLLSRDAQGVMREEARLRELGVANADAWQRTWAPGLVESQTHSSG